ncbi:hypothetical protein BDF22DRAFT_675301 [Syncephalis plumigaleata]|nr:hypothetical protein BDF22DRAFT_675301 [Syncephalis plumigaleata]
MQHDMQYRSSRSSVYRESSPRVPSPKQAPPRSPVPKEWHLPLPPPPQAPSWHHFSMAVGSPHENSMMRVSTPPLTPPEHSPAAPAVSLHQPRLASVPSHAYTGCITTAPLSPAAATVSLHPASLGVALLPPTPVALITPTCYDLQSVSIGYANSPCGGQPRILLPMMTTTPNNAAPANTTAHGYAHNDVSEAISMRDYRERTPSGGASNMQYSSSMAHFNTSWQPRSDEDRRQVNALGAHLRL